MFFVKQRRGFCWLFYSVSSYFIFLFSGVCTLIHIWKSSAVDERNHSSSETSLRLGLKIETMWRRQGVVLKANKCDGKVFSSLCIPSVYLTLVTVREQGGEERGRRDFSK